MKNRSVGAEKLLIVGSNFHDEDLRMFSGVEGSSLVRAVGNDMFQQDGEKVFRGLFTGDPEKTQFSGRYIFNKLASPKMAAHLFARAGWRQPRRACSTLS